VCHGMDGKRERRNPGGDALGPIIDVDTDADVVADVDADVDTDADVDVDVDESDSESEVLVLVADRAVLVGSCKAAAAVDAAAPVSIGDPSESDPPRRRSG